MVFRKENEDGNEYFDSSDSIKAKAKVLAASIKEGGENGTVFFTGAGISTSANIPDYRGPNGVWTLREKGLVPDIRPLENAKPTFAHYVIAKLVKDGFVSGVVSTNIDSLHVKSGVPKDKITELHGNCFVEHCDKCDLDVWRDFDVTKTVQSNHCTGRTCDSCGNELKDTIIHFKEPLKERVFGKGKEFSKAAQVGVVLGTSLRVRPASDLPLIPATLFVCNLQKTPHDHRSKEVIRAKTDLFMYLVAKELNLKIDDVEYSPPVDWEKEYDDLEKISKEKEREFSRKNLQGMMTDQTKSIKAPKKDEVNGENDVEDRKIEPVAPTPILITDCHNSSFQLTNNKVVKIVVLNCTNVNISISGRVLTGVMEVINSKKVNVCIQKSLPTIQIDNSQDVVLGFVSSDLCGSIISSGNSSLKVAPGLDCAPFAIEFVGLEKEEDVSLCQYMTRIMQNKMVTEKVVREGNGYATTKREKDAADAKDERNRVILEKHFAGLIGLKPKE